MPTLTDHPLRFRIANELHARPFPKVAVPARAAFIALKPDGDLANRDRAAELAHLQALLDRYGTAHPQPGATHFMARIGKNWLKWESHTEFVTYTVFSDGMSERAFDAVEFDVFPRDWLATAPGARITSALIRIERQSDVEAIKPRLNDWFVAESLAVSFVIDAAAVIAADFRMDPAGHMRFAIFANEGCGARRIGRIVQRLCEIETYKAMAMFGFCRVSEISDGLGAIDDRLNALIAGMSAKENRPDETLSSLLVASAELEQYSARSNFRFGATKAYEAIVSQRIRVLRETRFEGRQTFAEFMNRRFDPAMRTVVATEKRLEQLVARGRRAGDLLRTQVDVERSAQSQQVLERMDQRADLQLRLQHTVEGLSVVAISYYAVNLLSYMLLPFAKKAGIDKIWLAAGLTPIAVLIVWMMIRQIKKRFH